MPLSQILADAMVLLKIYTKYLIRGLNTKIIQSAARLGVFFAASSAREQYRKTHSRRPKRQQTHSSRFSATACCFEEPTHYTHKKKIVSPLKSNLRVFSSCHHIPPSPPLCTSSTHLPSIVHVYDRSSPSAPPSFMSGLIARFPLKCTLQPNTCQLK